MSKFSVGDRVVASDAWIQRKEVVGKGVKFARPAVGTIAHDGVSEVLRLDDPAHATPAIAWKDGMYNDVGWSFHDHELAPLHRFSVNDKVTIKRWKLVGVVNEAPDDQHEGYVVITDDNRWFVVSDDDLDPYVEPAPETPDDDNRELIAFIEGRMAKGIDTYGHGVRVDDGNAEYDWLVMALEEVADKTIYLAAEIIRLKRLRGLIVGQAKASRIDSHYIAVARELATMNGWTITNALDAMVSAGFASAYYANPDPYLHEDADYLAKTVDEKRKEAR